MHFRFLWLLKGWQGQLNFQILLFSVAFLLISWPHQSVTVAQVHPTLLENNGYKTMPIKTRLLCNSVNISTDNSSLGLSKHSEEAFLLLFLQSERATVSAMDGTAWSKLRPFLETLIGKCTHTHKHTHAPWVVWNQRGEEEMGEKTSLHSKVCAEAAADCPSMPNQFPSTHF